MPKLPEGAPFPLVRSKVHETVISDCEYITDIYSSSNTFVSTEYRIAAWLSQTFLNLSLLVSPYELYRIDSLEFYMKPVTEELYTGTQLQTGYWGMSFVSDPLDTAIFQDKSQFLSSAEIVSAKSTEPLYLKCDMRKSRHVMDRYLFTNRGNTQQDIRLTDYGILYIGNGQQMSSGFMLGSLYARYKVSCRKLVPVPTSGPNPPQPGSLGFCNYSLTNYVTLPLGATQTLMPGSQFSLQFVTYPYASPYTLGVSQIIIFPDALTGFFMFQMQIQGTSSGWNWGQSQFYGTSDGIMVSDNFQNYNPNNWSAIGSPIQTFTSWINITSPGSYQQTGQIDNANIFLIDYSGMQLVGSPSVGSIVISQFSGEGF